MSLDNQGKNSINVLVIEKSIKPEPDASEKVEKALSEHDIYSVAYYLSDRGFNVHLVWELQIIGLIV